MSKWNPHGAIRKAKHYLRCLFILILYGQVSMFPASTLKRAALQNGFIALKTSGWFWPKLPNEWWNGLIVFMGSFMIGPSHFNDLTASAQSCTVSSAQLLGGVWGVSQLLWPVGWIHLALFCCCCLRGERGLWTTDHLWARVNQVVSSWLVNHQASVKLVGSKDKTALKVFTLNCCVTKVQSCIWLL